MPFDLAQESVRQAHHEQLDLMVEMETVETIKMQIYCELQCFHIWQNQARIVTVQTCDALIQARIAFI
jgi:hypothetical protein